VASPSFINAPSPNFLLMLWSASSSSEVDLLDVLGDVLAMFKKERGG